VPSWRGADTHVWRAETHLGAWRDSQHKGRDESRPGSLRGCATSATWQTVTVISGQGLSQNQLFLVKIDGFGYRAPTAAREGEPGLISGAPLVPRQGVVFPKIVTPLPSL